MKHIRYIKIFFFCILIMISINLIAEDSLINLEINIILAKTDETGIDTRLKELSEKLKKFLNFSSYRLISSQEISPATGEITNISIPGKQTFSLTYLRKEQHQATIKLDNKGLNSFTTVIRLKENGTFLIKGPSIKEGDIILSIKLLNNNSND